MKLKIQWISTLVCSFAVIMSITALVRNHSEVASSDFYIKKSSDGFVNELVNRAKQSVKSSPEVNSKEDIYELLNHLLEFGFITEHGSDDLRIKYVNTQSCIEQVLSGSLVLGELKQLLGVIHTPQPATPLCTEVNNLDEQLLDPSIRDDLHKQFTVRSRAVILRDYLSHGGSLYIVYPQGGLEKRTPAQQAIYQKELKHYEGYLFDAVLDQHEMDVDMVGATYFLRNTKDELYVFSIKSRQANSPSADSEWGIWLGLIENPIIALRVNIILDYLEAHNGPAIRYNIL